MSIWNRHYVDPNENGQMKDGQCVVALLCGKPALMEFRGGQWSEEGRNDFDHWMVWNIEAWCRSADLVGQVREELRQLEETE